MLTPSQQEYVYLIGSRKFGWYKIGKARKPSIRVTQLGILLPFKVMLIALWSTSRGLLTERMMHEKYADYAINGEWFGIPPESLVRISRDQQPFDSKLIFSLFDPATYEKSERLGIGANFSNIEKDVAIPKGIFGKVRREATRQHAEQWLMSRQMEFSKDNWSQYGKEIRADFREKHGSQMDDFFALAGKVVV